MYRLTVPSRAILARVLWLSAVRRGQTRAHVEWRGAPDGVPRSIPAAILSDWIAIGTLSAPSKMPGASYSLPAGSACPIGSKLMRVRGSTCSGCYAMKGRYIMRETKRAVWRRLGSLQRDLGAWTQSMVTVLRWYAEVAPEAQRYIRWHDSGDVQSPAHFGAIVQIARAVPELRFWLPTREYGVVSSYLRAGGKIPKNLVVRLSAPMVDGRAPTAIGLPVSTVHRAGPPEGARVCPAPQQSGKCGSCRSCWSPKVAHVSYHAH